MMKVLLGEYDDNYSLKILSKAREYRRLWTSMANQAMFPAAHRWKHHLTFFTLRTVPARQMAGT